MAKLKQKTEKKDVYDIITERICTLLEQGKIPWRKEWTGGNTTQELPRNVTNGKEYEGINKVLLDCLGFERPFFLTFKQAKALGGNIKKGEKGFPVVYWKVGNRSEIDANGELKTKKTFLLKYYTVFNIEQCENCTFVLPEKPTPNTEKTPEELEAMQIQVCEDIILNMPNAPRVDIKESSRAFYRRSTDTVVMPLISQFDSPQGYYSTFFHELAHSTGHKKRLNRKELQESHAFGDFEYSKEELTAEFTAAFLCSQAGIFQDTMKNNTAYIQSWLNVLKNNKKWLIEASGKAKKATEYILGSSSKKEDTQE